MPVGGRLLSALVTHSLRTSFFLFSAMKMGESVGYLGLLLLVVVGESGSRFYFLTWFTYSTTKCRAILELQLLNHFDQRCSTVKHGNLTEGGVALERSGHGC